MMNAERDREARTDRSPRPHRTAYTAIFLAGLLALAVAGPAVAIDLRSWDDKIPQAGQRFKVLTEFGGEAVLDKESQLVWDRTATGGINWVPAAAHCYQKVVGGRRGWRLPTIAELATLVDVSQSSPALPSGHPFSVPPTPPVWSSTTDAGDATKAWFVEFGTGDVLSVGKGAAIFAWCVRGGQGQPAQ